MKYTKPHVINTEVATNAIMNTHEKDNTQMVDISLQQTNAAYSADE